MSIVLETPRLVLRHLEERDAAFILGLLNDPDWLRFIGDRGVRTLDGARAYLRNGPIAMYAKVGFSLFCVDSKTTREPIGICGLIKRDTLDDVDLGFAFMPLARGAGYAHEAAAATMAYARDTLALQRIVAIVSPENVRSIALLEKLGFRFERSLRLLPTDTQETLLYASE
ncbi:GNAT family N-acetyltransferase [Vulgatibacter incomptus]|uniref:Acetyltransferase, GNAT family n=1 Tax=Vulgatibacter incomptus TaxID=1391653 RepID=A0A0K1PGD5_9BACT|nr:GNAT family N-acetyltransferase [Vulgatibacter incomptus]AKU92580.1 Acetyltransferase, GNAT family [Vulgatibacter incomptus]